MAVSRSDTLTFDVGGSIFEVALPSLRTMCNPNSRLVLAIEARDKDDESTISISANPDLFPYILDMHRQCGHVTIPSNVSKEALLQEARSLGLVVSRESIVEEDDAFRQKMGQGRSTAAEDYFRAWTVDQVADWLQGVQQGRFARCVKAVHSQNVDGPALAAFSPEALKTLGVMDPRSRASLFAAIRHEAESGNETLLSQGQSEAGPKIDADEQNDSDEKGEAEKRLHAAVLMLRAIFGESGAKPFIEGIAQWRSENGATILGSDPGPVGQVATKVPKELAAMCGTNGILVVARLRPILQNGPDCAALEVGDFESVTAMAGGIVVHECGLQRDGKTPKIEHRYFRMHKAINATCDEQLIFDIATPLVDSAVQNSVHTTVLCYGQTGSGKTHTVGHLAWHISRYLYEVHRAELIVLEAFELRGGAKGLVSQSSNVFSLHDDSKPELPLFEGAGGAAHVGGSKAVVAGQGQILNLSHCMLASSPAELITLFREAEGRRTSRDTERNAASSRTHGFYRFYLAAASRSDILDSPEVIGTGACIELVDLAGSESNKDCLYHDRVRIEERAKINASLQALNSCIQKSVSGASYVPYRADKLTQLLRPCFAKPAVASSSTPTVLFLACLSPLASDAQQSLRTLTYTQELAGFKPKPTQTARQKKFSEPYVKRLVAAVQTGEIAELQAAISEAQRNGITGPERRAALSALKALEAAEQRDDVAETPA